MHARLSGSLLALVVSAASVLAHTTKISYSDVRVVADQALSYTLEVSPHDLAVLVGLAGSEDPLVPRATFVSARERIRAAVRAGIVVQNDGAVCQPGAFELDDTNFPETLRLNTLYQCAEPLEYLTITFDLFFSIDPRHKNIGKIHGQIRTEEFLLAADLPEFAVDVSTVANTRGPLARGWQFLRLGVEHIFTGYDHTLFLFALILAGGRLGYLVRIVTAFTVAHSLTLIFATLGIVTLPGRWVESLIALSITYVALENFFITHIDKRWVVTFVFGLIHGFGFYGVLRDLQLPRQGLALSLFPFNLGVEIGQVVIVALCYPALFFLTKQRWRGWVIYGLSSVIFCVGVYWFVQRTFLA
jgi:hypothetical protein